ncbi:MAG: hypothetical protein M1817_001774 [Caeruleum heppii]|nr:MAG: hypothetical protein M1817_001774 [Caeruleum heppii]
MPSSSFGRAATDFLADPHHRIYYHGPPRRDDNGRRCLLPSDQLTPPYTPINDLQSLAYPHLRLSFDQEPKDKTWGWVFGTDPCACDVLLPNQRYGSISRRHFRIHFDVQGRVVLTDTSTNGSDIAYLTDAQDWASSALRRDFTWILFSGMRISLRLPEDELAFELILVKHTTCEAEYQQQLNNYLGATQCARNIGTRGANAPLVGATSFPSPPIYLKVRELGRGGFGQVHEALNVSSGEKYAMKQFNLVKGHEDEIEILQILSHDHIVKYLGLVDDTPPRLLMEFVPLGHLWAQHREDPLCETEKRLLLRQGLDAIQYLHLHGVTHRDIKPENILVQGRKESFQIKLADFGLSKDTQSLRTNVGTDGYTAPEVEKGRAYTNNVDIWSLGVVMLIIVGSMVKPTRLRPKIGWTQTALDAATDLAAKNPGQAMPCLLSQMLRVKSRTRPSATECLDKAMDLGLWSSNRSVSFSSSAKSTQEAPALIKPASRSVSGAPSNLSKRSAQSFETQGGGPLPGEELTSAHTDRRADRSTVNQRSKRRRLSPQSSSSRSSGQQ